MLSLQQLLHLMLQEQLLHSIVLQLTLPLLRYEGLQVKLQDLQTITSGSVLTESDLDTDSTQSFFMSQEAIDDAADKIKIDPADFQWDATNKRIKNVAAPTADTDAVNKSFISTNIPNITTVSGIASDVTTVAGISANVTTVAGNNANVTDSC